MSRISEVSISIYLRHPPETQTTVPARTNNDYFLGTVKIQPNFAPNHLENQLFKIVGGTGSMFIQLCYTSQVSNERRIRSSACTYVLNLLVAGPARHLVRFL